MLLLPVYFPARLSRKTVAQWCQSCAAWKCTPCLMADSCIQHWQLRAKAVRRPSGHGQKRLECNKSSSNQVSHRSTFFEQSSNVRERVGLRIGDSWAVGKQTKQLFQMDFCSFGTKTKQLAKCFVPGGTIISEQLFRNSCFIRNNCSGTISEQLIWFGTVVSKCFWTVGLLEKEAFDWSFHHRTILAPAGSRDTVRFAFSEVAPSPNFPLLNVNFAECERV